MLFSILNIFFSAILIILFIRYFVQKYRFYGFGPILIAIITLTERLLRPLKRIVPQRAYSIEDRLPLAAICVVLLIRGVVIWIFGEATLNDMVRIHGVGGNIPLLYAIAVSFGMGILLLAELIIAFLFASLMVSRRGITMGGNAGFMCFQERTFTIFRWTQTIIRSNNLVILFGISSLTILFTGSFLASFFSLTFLYGLKAFSIAWVVCLFDILQALIYVYSLVLLLSILASWIAADQFSMVIQIVRSLADPYLGFFRRIIPWARIDFIDLSPIFAFLCLNPGLTYLLISLRMSILREIMITRLFI